LWKNCAAGSTCSSRTRRRACGCWERFAASSSARAATAVSVETCSARSPTRCTERLNSAALSRAPGKRAHVAAYAQTGFDPGFKDQSGWLVFFGILEIAIGAFCALMLLLTLLNMALTAFLPPLQVQLMSARMMLPSALTYVAAGVFFIWLGIGTLKG